MANKNQTTLIANTIKSKSKKTNNIHLQLGESIFHEAQLKAHYS